MNEFIAMEIYIIIFLTITSNFEIFGNCAIKIDEPLIIPEDFLLGASSASYQIEGAWNEDGKSESIWDNALHSHPEWVLDKSNGDGAADTYHKFEQDIKILKEMGLTGYRFSISWPRILPNGDLTKINQAGIDWYNHFINRLLEEGIEPIVTIYHWDMPQYLQERVGGMANPIIADYFEDYANVLFSNFGDRVKWWITFNEPTILCPGYGEGPVKAPGIENPDVGDYLCGHALLLSHARIYRLYNTTYRDNQKGKVGITLAVQWYEPKTESEEDKEAARVYMDFEMGWFAHPIFTQEGDYPQSMKDRIENISLADGLRRSRLPKFTSEQINDLKGSSDFLGLNHYTSYLLSPDESNNIPSRSRDSGTKMEQDPTWPGSSAPWLKIVPWGMRKLIVEATKRYPGYDILITENGYADDGLLQDDSRIDYLVSYMREMLLAVHEDNAPVIGYFHWSLFDNFEWMNGYTQKFGLYKVDYDNDELPRIAKDSSKVYAGIVSSRQVPPPSFYFP